MGIAFPHCACVLGVRDVFCIVMVLIRKSPTNLAGLLYAGSFYSV
jgi:hypothetical protein